MAKEISPEEKLLKIIENPSAALFKNPDSGSKRNVFGEVNSSLTRLKSLFDDKEKLRSYFNLGLLNKAIICSCVLITVFLIFDFFKGGSDTRKRLIKLNSSAAAKADKKESQVSIPEERISEIMRKVAKRNIFTLSPAASETAPRDIDYSKIISDLKLVGILWSDNPQAMIEDSKNKRTCLLSNGDQISDMKVKKIYSEKVILTGKDNKEWELR
ncbi:MAG: hypothetical protein PHV68_07955 [Candidatus Gastranaerophilales bacterium]|nr:hypothetical protein [Candidatus Gastranaerophilales bacterium]